MNNELFDIVNENNEVIGKKKRNIVHSRGLFHRTVNIFVFNSKGDIFLQQRNADKDICPLVWDLSTAGHLKIGESYLEAAKRELKEELGINAKIVRIRGPHLQKNEYNKGAKKDYEFVETYKALWNEKIKIDKSEVADGRFFKVSEIKEMIRQNKDRFTPWFLEEWEFIENNESKFLLD